MGKVGTYDDYDDDLPAQGDSFKLTLKQPPTADASRSPRCIPALPYMKETSYTLVTSLHDKSRVDLNSQTWIARPEDIDPSDGDRSAYVVLKFVVPSLHERKEYRPRNMTRAAKAYEVMQDCQGSTLPYFFGLQEVTLASEERVPVFALEYIETPYTKGFEEFQDLINKEDSVTPYKEYNEYCKLARSGIETIRLAHERKILHGDIHEGNVLVDPTYARTIVIDWNDPMPVQVSFERRTWSEWEDITYLFLRCNPHRVTLRDEPFCRPNCGIVEDNIINEDDTDENHENHEDDSDDEESTNEESTDEDEDEDSEGNVSTAVCKKLQVRGAARAKASDKFFANSCNMADV